MLDQPGLIQQFVLETSVEMHLMMTKSVPRGVSMVEDCFVLPP